MSVDTTYLNQLKDYYARHRVLPSYALIGQMVGLRSKASVAALVGRLQRQGFLDTAPGRRLIPTRKFFQHTWVGSVPAGTPSAATELQDLINIEDYLVEQPSVTVFFKVKGDSMVGAGIYSGDIAVVKKTPQANTDDIVVGIVDGEYTLKELAEDKQGFFLRSNPPSEPIRPQGELLIYGVMVGLVRKYGRS